MNYISNSPQFANPQQMDASNQQQFMVDFTLPDSLSDDFINSVQCQKDAVNKLFTQGKLLNYALSLEKSKLWAIFNVRSEAELMELVSVLPLSRFMKVRISELTFLNMATPFVPVFSVN